MFIYTKEQLAKAHIEQKAMLEKHKKLLVTYEPVRKKKTQKQLGHIFGNLVSFLKAELEELGSKYTTDEIKLSIYNRVCVVEELNDCFGSSILKRRKTLSMMTTEECSEFIEKVVDDLENNLGFTLPPTIKYTWLHSASDDDFLKASQYCSSASSSQPWYLSHIRKQHCLMCGVRGCEAHHMRVTGGTGLKSEDCYTMPLCHKCHMNLHRDGEFTSYKKLEGLLNGRTMKQWCEMNYYKESMKK